MFTLAVYCALATCQQQSVYHQLFPVPAGKNGYEDYAMAADIMSSNAANSIGKRLIDMWESGESYYTIAKDAVSQFGKACDLIRQGNEKNVFDPRSDITFDTAFPELSGFKEVAKLLTYEAYINFSEGKPAAGAKSILAGLKFASNIQSRTFINFLVGVAMESIMFRALDTHLPQLSLKDAETLQRFCKEILKKPTPLSGALKGELDFQRKYVDDYLNGHVMELLNPLSEEPSAEAKEMEKLVKALTPTQRQDLKSEALAIIDKRAKAIDELLAKPESEWRALTDVAIQNRILRAFFENAWLVLENAMMAGIRERTKYRLALLHGAITEYRWIKGKLPASLRDLNAPELIKDPANGSEFVYEPLESGYRLLSKGTSATGVIFLSNRPKPVQPPEEGPPPPRNQNLNH